MSLYAWCQWQNNEVSVVNQSICFLWQWNVTNYIYLNTVKYCYCLQVSDTCNSLEFFSFIFHLVNHISVEQGPFIRQLLLPVSL